MYFSGIAIAFYRVWLHRRNFFAFFCIILYFPLPRDETVSSDSALLILCLLGWEWNRRIRSKNLELDWILKHCFWWHCDGAKHEKLCASIDGPTILSQPVSLWIHSPLLFTTSVALGCSASVYVAQSTLWQYSSQQAILLGVVSWHRLEELPCGERELKSGKSH